MSFDAAMVSLRRLAETKADAVRRFLDDLGDLRDLVQIDMEPAPRRLAGVVEVHVRLWASERLVAFLSAETGAHA